MNPVLVAVAKNTKSAVARVSEEDSFKREY